MPKPVTESHRLAGDLDAFGARILYKSGVGDQILILMKCKHKTCYIANYSVVTPSNSGLATSASAFVGLTTPSW